MERKVVIIGCGNVGSTFAYALYKENICNILLINHNKCKANSNMLDILDCELTTSAYSIAAGDYSDIFSNDIVVICTGDSTLLRSGDRFAEYENSYRIAKDIVSNLNKINFNGILINTMNPCDEITNVFRLLNTPNNQIIGSGTLLETLRLRRIVYEKYGYKTNAIVVGNHGNNNAVFSDEKIPNNVLEDVHDRVWKIYNGKGFTNFGISNALIMIVKAILNDSCEEICISTLCCEKYGFINKSISVPCILGKFGVVEVKKNPKILKILNKLFKKEKQDVLHK